MLLAFNLYPYNVQATATCPRNRFYIGFVSFHFDSLLLMLTVLFFYFVFRTILCLGCFFFCFSFRTTCVLSLKGETTIKWSRYPYKVCTYIIGMFIFRSRDINRYRNTLTHPPSFEISIWILLPEISCSLNFKFLNRNSTMKFFFCVCVYLAGVKLWNSLSEEQTQCPKRQ